MVDIVVESWAKVIYYMDKYIVACVIRYCVMLYGIPCWVLDGIA